MGEILFHVFIVGALAVFYGEVLRINTSRAADLVGPAGFPTAIILLAGVLTLYSGFKAVWKYIGVREKHLFSKVSVPFLGLLGTIVGFLLLVEAAGFFISSFLLVAVIFTLLGERRKLRIGLFALVVALLFTLMFGRVLSLPLPRGLGMLKDASYLLY